jgi:CspA family cold shock protein
MIAHMSGNQLPLGSSQMFIVLAIFWSMGFLSIIGYIYGRKIKRNFRGETGTIKWFDPSKGYGFLIRDKGGDLFVHLRSVQSQDRRKLKENTRVRFSVEDTEKGPQAENIRII